MTREQTLEYFTFLESEKTRLLIEAVKNGVIDQLKNSTDTQASDNFMAIQSARAFDKLAIEKRVYETEYMDALAYYKVDSEPEAIKIMQQNFLQLQAARESNPPKLFN